MKVLNKLIIVAMIFMNPLAAIAGMTILVEAEMEAISGRTGISLGIIASLQDTDCRIYEDFEYYCGELIARDSVQSEKTLDMPTAWAENVQNIENLPLSVKFTDIPNNTLGKEKSDVTDSRAGTTCCSNQLYIDRLSKGFCR
ncbi:MAG: hypothetical protein SWO11_04820 [Thermodesulfobacteriota bacterium]|nr:hypothetical protein [Thermodesulfobacteriota bacterium]